MQNNKSELDKAIELINAKNKKSENYDVGYGKPPKNTRFTKGQSGNPAGRKKKVIPDTLFQALSLELCQLKTITNANGLKEKVPVFSILAKKIVQDAIQNDGPSRKFLMQSNNLFKCNFNDIVKSLIEQKNPVEDECTEEERNKLRQYLYETLDKLYRREQLNE